MFRSFQPKHIIAELVSLRNSKNLSQQEVAKFMGCSQSRVSKIESGKNLKLADLIFYANAIGAKLQITLE